MSSRDTESFSFVSSSPKVIPQEKLMNIFNFSTPPLCGYSAPRYVRPMVKKPKKLKFDRMETLDETKLLRPSSEPPVKKVFKEKNEDENLGLMMTDDS